MNRCTNPGTATRWLLLVGMAVLLLASQVAAGNEYVGSETCLDCHDTLGATFANSVHGRIAQDRFPGVAAGCESCHGPGGQHVEEEDPALIFKPTPAAGDQANDACLACHQTGVTMEWATSVHANSGVTCVSCHSIHTGKLLVQEETDLCLSCHQEYKAQLSLPSHHPIREGFMSCTSCHDPHSGGYTGQLASENTSRELCLGCHAEYRGPFIFEHSPVEEDCTICHNPHGTVANNLLQQNEPFLCLQCHQPHFHTALASYEGDYSAPAATYDPDTGWPGYEGWSGTSHSDGFKRSMLTKCTQCHQSVHGTDLPSQSIPGQGRALNR